MTAAKLEVFGECGIDLPAGPSEVMVVADATADRGPRRRRPALAGRARPGLPCPAGHLGRGRRRGRRGGAGPSARDRGPARDPGAVAGELAPWSCSRPSRDAGARLRQRLRPGAPLGGRGRRRGGRGAAAERGLALRRARTRPSPPATTPRARTTSCPPAAWPAPAARCRPRATASSSRCSGSRRDGLAAIRDAVEAIAEAEGLIAHKRAVEVRFEEAGR